MQAQKNSKKVKGAFTRLLLRELSMLGNVVSEVPSVHQIHDQVEVLRVLEGVLHVDQEPERVSGGPTRS